MNTNYVNEKLKEYNIETIAVVLLVVNSILYMLIFRNLKAKVVDQANGNNTIYPTTAIFTYTIATLFVIASGIFLYYAYIDLQERIEEHNKTGYPASLEPYYNFFYIQILQFITACYFFYNVFVVSKNEPSFLR